MILWQIFFSSGCHLQNHVAKVIQMLFILFRNVGGEQFFCRHAAAWKKLMPPMENISSGVIYVGSIVESVIAIVVRKIDRPLSIRSNSGIPLLSIARGNISCVNDPRMGGGGCLSSGNLSSLNTPSKTEKHKLLCHGEKNSSRGVLFHWKLVSASRQSTKKHQSCEKPFCYGDQPEVLVWMLGETFTFAFFFTVKEVLRQKALPFIVTRTRQKRRLLGDWLVYGFHRGRGIENQEIASRHCTSCTTETRTRSPRPYHLQVDYPQTQATVVYTCCAHKCKLFATGSPERDR